MRHQTTLVFVTLAFLSLATPACGPGSSSEDNSGPTLVVTTDDDQDTGTIDRTDTVEPPPDDAGRRDAGVDSWTPPEDTGGGSNGDTGTPGDTASPDDAGDDGGIEPTAEEVDPMCVDGKYSETLPNPGADISTAKANYSSSNLESFVDKVLQKRYPVGDWIIDGGLQHYPQRNCLQDFLRDTSSASSVINGLSTAVHECGHLFDRGKSGRGASFYGFTSQTTMECSGGDTTSRGGETFARSRILDDKYQSEHPPCGGSPGRDCDSYAGIYLDGDPDNGTFESGDQGFNMLLEEAVQYVNSLATDYAFKDHIPPRRSTSAMDGILTFLWYTERYLRMARLQYPRAYDKLTNDPCWRKAILTMWGRAWLMLGATEHIDKLGIAESKLFRLVREPELLKEIDRVRQAHGCP